MSTDGPTSYVVSFRDTGLRRNRMLEAFLGQSVDIALPFRGHRPETHIGWGRRPSGDRARKRAISRGQSFLLMEDGFIRSLHPGQASASCSLVMDDLGIYYDATKASRLEALIAAPLSPSEHERADRLIEQWCASGVSKYNHAPGPAPAALPGGPYVLVLDQTANDASVKYGLANQESFRRMLDEAVTLFPTCRVVVKEHPEVKAGRKKGYLAALLDGGDYPEVVRLPDDVHVVPLLTGATAVFTVTSQVGFEALLHKRPVFTFGMPFYAGWGLTNDALPAPPRRLPVTLKQMAFAALVRYAVYALPNTGQRCEVEDAIRYIALQRTMYLQLPSKVEAVGFSHWKKPILRDFLDGCEVRFHRTLDTVPHGTTALRWGRSIDTAGREDLEMITVEDGFLRSVGLGAQLVRPVSWVFDRHGIYYDATRPSDLEMLLEHAEFDGALLGRAAQLRAAIVEGGITKYNIGAGAWQRPAGLCNVILVVGQVESDASLRFGAPHIRSNRELLLAVRSEFPDAYIVYKPHPDVMEGLRGDRADERALTSLCDVMVDGYPMDQLIDSVDQVHVLTSLSGFEALLRGKPVTTHGIPFYAGWGLTKDHCPTPRRKRQLSLDMLVAGALILYPRYVLGQEGGSISRGFATPEQVVAHLKEWKLEHPASGRVLRHLMRPILRRAGEWHAKGRAKAGI